MGIRLRDIETRVTDHALVRYLERVLKIDLDVVRREILTPAVVDALKTGATGVTVNGVKFIAKDGILITVISNPPKGKTRKAEIEEDRESA